LNKIAVMQKKRRLWYLTAFTCISLLSYLSVLIPPTVFWPAVFASYAIPGLLVLNALLFLFLIFFNRILILFPLIGLIGGLPFVMLTYSIHPKIESEIREIDVLSYNAKLFRKAKMYEEFSGELIDWVAEDSSDIKCIQEYSTNSLWKPLDVTKKNLDQGYFGFTHAAAGTNTTHNPGLAIFSKFPIINRGVVWVSPGTFNDGIFADIKIDRDTLRVYNVHLASMQLQLYQYKNVENYPSKMKNLISRLKYGAERRYYQIERLLEHAADSPYPFIICGDFNETPYSYNYFELKRNFSSAFEESGNGFGFSLNSILFFLRIDHQFYSPGIEAVSFSVDRSINISDHFPTRGVFKIEKSRNYPL
jgi:endonuclease/exonuclease/phosphatase family metal-dependent hydrolase